jgi:hypothetical protein
LEDVIEILRESNESVPIPLELPDEDLLVVIEEELLVALPDDLRLFLLTVSDIVYGSLEPATVTDSGSHTYLPEMAAIAWSLGMPRYLLPICEEKGAYYCIYPDGNIGLWDGSICDETWDTIWHWSRDIWLAL